MNHAILASMVRANSSLPVAMVAIFSIFLSAPLPAQSLDYGALEQLFQEPVTISVDGSPQRVSDVPATMEIITAEDIRRSGAKDIPGVLRHVGGIDTLEWGNDDMDVGVRGYDQIYSPRLLVLVDGRQVYVDDYGYTPWSSVPVELGAIRQIEIVKGSSSALFGFNAVGGVINIITYNPLYDTTNAISSTGGTQELATGSAVLTHKFGERAGLSLSAGGNWDSDFSTPLEPGESRDREHRTAVKVSSVMRLTEALQLALEATYSDSHVNELTPDFEMDQTEYHIPSVKAQLTATSRFGLVQATTYTNWLSAADPTGYLNQPYHFKNRVTVLQLQDIFKQGTDHTFRATAEYRHTTEATTPVTGAHVHYDVFAASGMWHWEITPALSLTNALRVDYVVLGRNGFLPADYPFTNSDWNRTDTWLSFNSGLVWKPRATDSVRLVASRGAQLPSLVASGALLLDTPSEKLTGSPWINPSTVTNYEIGWEHVLSDHHLLFRVTAFDQNSSDVMAPRGAVVPSPGGAYITPTNIGDSHALGLEFELKGTLPNSFRWGVHYRPEWISDHFIPSAQDGAAYVDYYDTTPFHLLKANLGWANRRWEIDGYLQYHSAVNGTVPLAAGGTTDFPIGAFVAMDGRVAFKLNRRITWAASGQNLTHASQRQTAGPAVERRVLGTLSFTF